MTDTELFELDSMFQSLNDIDWNDIDNARSIGAVLLNHLASEPSLLRQIVMGIVDNPDLLSGCEQDNQIQLLLRRSDTAGHRLRLHIMPSGMRDHPHGHRYSFLSKVLRGDLQQLIYPHLDDGVNPIPKEIAPGAAFGIPQDFVYFLSHQIVHSLVVVRGPVVTLFLRGPAQKSQASNRDSISGAHRWQRSAATGESEGMHVPLTRQRLLEVFAELEGIGVI